MNARRGPPPFDTIPVAAWRTDVLVRFSHCDPAGIVYFARWFDIMNGVLEDWFSAALSIGFADLIARRRVGVGYAGIQSDFVRPGFMGDVVTFTVLVERIGGGSYTLAVHGYRGDEPVLTIRPVVATTSLDERRPIPIPDDLRAALEGYRDRVEPGAVA